jgi:hypothetical protein
MEGLGDGQNPEKNLPSCPSERSLAVDSARLLLKAKAATLEFLEPLMTNSVMKHQAMGPRGTLATVLY